MKALFGIYSGHHERLVVSSGAERR